MNVREAMQSLQHLSMKLFAVPKPARGRFPPWLAGVAVGIAAFMFVMPETGVDVLVTYGPAGRGEYIEGVLPRNPRFALWLFWLIARLPWKWNYLLLIMISIPVLAAAVYWGGGDYRKAFLSFPFIWSAAYGQIDVFVVAGLALTWWSLQAGYFWLMGVGLSFACMLKPQVGIVGAVLLWLWSPNKWKPLAVPGVLMFLSLVQWGVDWPVSWVRAMLSQIVVLEGNWANSSLFPWVGWWGLLIWLPVLLVPMDRQARLRSVMAATALSLPYFPAYQLMILLAFPVSVAEWVLSGLPLLGKWGYTAAAAMPLLVVLSAILPWARRVLEHRFGHWRKSFTSS